MATSFVGLKTRVSSPLPYPYPFGDLSHTLESSDDEHGIPPAAPSSTYSQSVFPGLTDSKTLSTSDEEFNRLSGDGDKIDTSSFYQQGMAHSRQTSFDCHQHCRAAIPTSVSTTDVAIWEHRAASHPASRSQPALSGSCNLQPRSPSGIFDSLSVSRLPRTVATPADLHTASHRSTGVGLGRRHVSKGSRKQSLAFRPVSGVHSFAPSSNLARRRATNFISITRKYPSNRFNNIGITGSFVIDPQIRIPTSILRTFDSDMSLRGRTLPVVGDPTSNAGSRDPNNSNQKPNILLNVENTSIEVDVELIPFLESSSLSSSPILVHLKSKHSLPLATTTEFGQGHSLTTTIDAPLPRAALKIVIELLVELGDSACQSSPDMRLPSLSKMAQEKQVVSGSLRSSDSPKRRNLLQRRREWVQPPSARLPGSMNVDECTSTPFSPPPIRVAIPRTFHGPLTITTFVDDLKYPLAPSPRVYLSHQLQETMVLMSETSKQVAGQTINPRTKLKTGYFIHSLNPSDTSPDHFEAYSNDEAFANSHGRDSGISAESGSEWIFVTPSALDGQGFDNFGSHRRRSYAPPRSLIFEASTTDSEWSGDKIDIRIDVSGPSASSSSLTAPEVRLSYVDEEEPFVQYCGSSVNEEMGAVEEVECRGEENETIINYEMEVVEERRKATIFHWMSFGCMS